MSPEIRAKDAPVGLKIEYDLLLIKHEMTEVIVVDKKSVANAVKEYLRKYPASEMKFASDDKGKLFELNGLGDGAIHEIKDTTMGGGTFKVVDLAELAYR